MADKPTIERTDYPEMIYVTEVDFEDADFPLIGASASPDSGGEPYVRKAAVKVKPLVWNDRHENSHADVYSARQSHGQGPDAYMLARGSNIIGWHPNLEAAKSAAQADHESRVRQALEGLE